MECGEVLVVTGPPAAGKSAVASLLVQELQFGVHLRADYFWDEFIRNDFLRPWMPESDQQNRTVVKAVAAAAVEYAKGGYATVVDGIFGPWFAELIFPRFAAQGVACHYAVLLPVKEVTLKRSQSRTKTITESVLEKMHDEFSAHLEGYEKHVVDSTQLDVIRTAEVIREKLEAGQLIIR